MSTTTEATADPTGGGDGLVVTERTRLRRMREKGSHRRADLDAVLAAGFLCHLGVPVDGTTMVVPTAYGVDGDRLYLHGSVASRSLVQAPDTTVCVTVTHVDGLVLARSVFEHGVNYRCAMVYGIPRIVTDPEEKLRGLRALTEQSSPGQWEYVRQPSRKELAATSVLALDLTEASVKTRSGPPDDGDSEDAALGLWAGVLPVVTTFGEPVTDPALPEDLAAPAHVAERAGRVLGE
ncbi:pyridoxamine 5'-phosphate oxidase family protein [Streptomyces sp. SBC-4]|nr:pyridoxamine 5'-phosphate oxidase family protein [Streptomyces sp. SBC-4]MDV5146602.1 pyridoxamine 5'-phosphate oxidase family protein [Streptomyces sp. SBC-4]